MPVSPSSPVKKRRQKSPLMRLLKPKYQKFLREQSAQLSLAQKKKIAELWHTAEQGVFQEIRQYEAKRQNILKKYTSELLRFTRNEEHEFLANLETTAKNNEATYTEGLLQQIDNL